jgi:serine/threonine protein kinase
MADAARFLSDVVQLPAPGTQFGNYRLGSRIGVGGMGVVFEAQDLRLHRRVALKILPPDYAGEGDNRIKRFQQEAQAASALSHPNIVTIFDAGCEQECHYIAMEFVDGKTLRELIASKSPSIDRKMLLDVIAQTASALNAAHEAGIVHRDIKPENIMVRPDGLVKVLDFGLAKLRECSNITDRETSILLTRPGQLAGTVQYLSPEQVSGKPVDARSDLFSLGVVAYELGTCRRPFDGPTDGAIFDAILHETPSPPSLIRPELGSELDGFVLQALEKERDLRFQTASDLCSCCKRLSRDMSRPVTLRTAPAIEKPWRLGWLPWAATAVMAVLSGYLLYGKLHSRRSSSSTQTLVQVTNYAGSEMYPSFSPDGRQIAFSWDGEMGSNPGIYVKLAGETNALRLTTGVDAFPAWLSDGNRIAFARAGSNPGIYTVSALGGTERKMAGLNPNSQLSASPDGRWLAVSIDDPNDGGILLLPVVGGEPRRITRPKVPRFDRAPAFSPDGHRLAYAACASTYACNVFLQDLDSANLPRGSAREVAHVDASISGLTWTHGGGSLIYSASHDAAILPYLWQTEIDGRQPPSRLEIAGANAYSPSASPTTGQVVFQRDFGAEDTWQFRVGEGMRPLFVSSLSTNRNPQFSPDGTKIAFESSRSGGVGEIWVSQADGTRPVQLTNHLGRHQGTPRWSPDGQRIAFDSQGQDGRWDIYVIDAGGGSPRRITFDPSDEAMPFWSHDGSWIYFRSDRTGGFEIWRVPFAGGPQEQVTNRGGSVAFESLDGKTLFYSKGAMSGPLFERPLSGGEEKPLVPYINFKAFVPAADGIYYIGRRTDEGYYPLAFFQFSSRANRLLAKIQGRAYQGLTVSPDRKTILFCKIGGLGSDLMMIEDPK